MKLTKLKKKSKIQEEIDRLLHELEGISPYTDEYDDILNKVEKLKKLTGDPREKLSWNTVWIVGGSIGGTLLCIFHEELGHVISTKGMNFVLRGRA